MLLTLLLTASTFASSALDAELAQKVDHFAAAYQRSARAARDFDRELDAAVATGRTDFLRTSSAYRQLQALRAIQHADIEAIGDRVQEIRATNPEDADRATRALETKLALLDSAPAAQSLAAELNAHYAGLVSEERPDAVADEREPSPPSLTISLLPSLLDLEMAEVAARIDFAPAGAKIRPGTGPEGNMTGSNFPTGTWALTFDDGPSSKYTKQFVDTLTAHGIKGSFFCLAQNVSANRAVVDYQLRAGMSLNDHSYTHANLSKASAAALQHEIVDSAAVEAKVYGFRPEFFRLPYGAGVRQANVRELIASQGMVHVFWNVDTLDWQDKDPNVILARTQKQMSLEKKGIILFHDIHPQSLAATKLLLESTRRAGLRWVTIPQIRDELNGKK